MVRTVIIYASTHHGNTYQLVQTIACKYDITLINAEETHQADLSHFDLIGFASGIDFGRFYPSVETFLKKNLPPEKKVFFLFTCARPNKGFTKSIREEAERKRCIPLGEYGCKGYNTYGPWKWIGGMNKHHPTPTECNAALSFFESLLSK